MGTLANVKAVLAADATLLATATGGVWDISQTGEEGINRTTTPTAFDANLILKPLVLLRMRSSNPDFILQDDTNQYQSVREMLECWLYADDSYAPIETMQARIYALLHAKPLTGTFAVRWAGDIRNMKDATLDALVERSDYLCIVKRSV